MNLKNFIQGWIKNDSCDDAEFNGFIIKNNMLYAQRSVKILLAMKEDGYILLRFMNDTKNHLKKFLKVCDTDKIILMSREVNERYDKDDSQHFYAISNIFTYYVRGDLYDLFHEYKLDIFNLVVNYINFFDCEQSFYHCFEKGVITRNHWGRRRGTSIKEALIGNYLGWDKFGNGSRYNKVPDKYHEEFDIENLKRRYKLESMLLALDINI